MNYWLMKLNLSMIRRMPFDTPLRHPVIIFTNILRTFLYKYLFTVKYVKKSSLTNFLHKRAARKLLVKSSPVHVTGSVIGPEVGPLVAWGRATHHSRVRHQETHGLIVAGILLKLKNASFNWLLLQFTVPSQFPLVTMTSKQVYLVIRSMYWRPK